MSGSFEQMDVPPTLVSFAVTTEKADRIVSNEFKTAGSEVILLRPEYGADGLPVASSLIKVFEKVNKLLSKGTALSAYTLTYGGMAEAVLKMCLGNDYGFRFENDLTMDGLIGLWLRQLPFGTEKELR